jgi:hypothetical protein
MRPQFTTSTILFNSYRTFFTMQRSQSQLLLRRSQQTLQQVPQSSSLTQVATRDFSLKMRAVRAKYARVKKYKLKTKKSFQKRFEVCGGIRNKMFKFHA